MWFDYSFFSEFILEVAIAWLTRCNHKEIGLLYLILALRIGVLGASLRVLIRWTLVLPGRT